MTDHHPMRLAGLLTDLAAGNAEIEDCAGRLNPAGDHAIQVRLDNGPNQYIVTGATLVTGGYNPGVIIIDIAHMGAPT